MPPTFSASCTPWQASLKTSGIGCCQGPGTTDHHSAEIRVHLRMYPFHITGTLGVFRKGPVTFMVTAGSDPYSPMNIFIPRPPSPSFWCFLTLFLTSLSVARADDRLVGIWVLDEGFQVTDYTFRSDGRYHIQTRSTDPVMDHSFTEQGRYEVVAATIALWSYEYFGEPQNKPFEYQITGDVLTLVRTEFSLTYVCQFKPGSRADVLAREQVETNLIGRWQRHIIFAGTDEFTFRPGGYYALKHTPDDHEFPPQIIRGRYTHDGKQLILHPYSGVAAGFEVDVFGPTLTVIRRDPLFGEAHAYESIPGSRTEVQTQSAVAADFLARPQWQVGVWEIRESFLSVDLTLRPDGHYIAEHHTEFLEGTVRGRYELETGRIRLLPFVGQGIYARSNGDFGQVEHTRELDYYDGQLQFIDLNALSQSVILARQRPGSGQVVLEKTQEATSLRAQENWHVGLWEVHDPLGKMKFTFRPDLRYIASAGPNDTPTQVERGRYVVSAEKLTLAPYSGQGAPRGFELDLYDSQLFLIGDLSRMVIARKIPGSEIEVTVRTQDPSALKGERGGLLGLWTAPLPGQSAELVLRDDGEFRLQRCANGVVTHDYGLYTLNLASRSLVWDSRFTPVQTLGLDFYGDTVTFHGGWGAPSTYNVNLGSVDADIAASLAADDAEALIDASWTTRVPVGPRDPGAVVFPTADIPADPNPGRIFPTPTVLTQYQLYRRLIPGFVYFNVQGTILSVAVVNTREWHFFPTGRVLIRFRNYFAGATYPSTVVDISDTWGAYQVGPQPEQRDILHRYADNTVTLETDGGESMEMTLEDGRRHLFWSKDYQILSEWAAEQKPIPCQLPEVTHPDLLNTGLALTTRLPPDDIGEPQPIALEMSMSQDGQLTLKGTIHVADTVVLEKRHDLSATSTWVALQTNQLSAGEFTLPVQRGTNTAAFFRIRRI